MDTFDTAILNALQIDNRMTAEVMAERVGLSPTACQRRIKRLREQGAVAADIAVLSPEFLGNRITFLVHVVLVHGGTWAIDKFKREMIKVPEVQQCYYTTGDYDFLVVITARDVPEYEQLTRRIFFDNSDIQRFNTTVVMDTVKVGLQIPL